MHMASMHNPSDNPMMAGQPCGQTKPNHSIVCESVRYRMLSVQAESPQINLSLLPSTLLNTISIEDLLPLDRIARCAARSSSSRFFIQALASLLPHSASYLDSPSVCLHDRLRE